MTLPIMEIFSSIQGEGCHMGKFVTFIRLAGCNLACSFCDTKNSWDTLHKTSQVTFDEALSEITAHHVVITGGEPTIHPQLWEFVRVLKKHHYYVSIETNGTGEVPTEVDWITCSPKPDADYKIHPYLHPDELKYVVCDNFDPQVAIPEWVRERFNGKIWLQPDGTNSQTMEAAWRWCYNLAREDNRLRVGCQLHKLMEVD